MRVVKEQGGCFLAKVVARSTTGIAWKIGLKTEVPYFGLIVVMLQTDIVLIWGFICRFISLELVEVPILSNLWGTLWHVLSNSLASFGVWVANSPLFHVDYGYRLLFPHFLYTWFLFHFLFFYQFFLYIEKTQRSSIIFPSCINWSNDFWPYKLSFQHVIRTYNCYCNFRRQGCYNFCNMISILFSFVLTL